MLSFRNRQELVLLFVLTHELVFGSIENEKNKVETLPYEMISRMQDLWINEMKSTERASENSCDEAITAVSEAFNASQTWAMQMFDASSKVQSGIMNGNFRDLGMYDQCIAAKGEYNEINVQGKHCTVSFGTAPTAVWFSTSFAGVALSGLSSAVCVPSCCNETEVAERVTTALEDLSALIDLSLQVNGVTCVRVGTEDFTTGEVVTIIFFSVIGGFIVFCTICDLVKKYKTTSVSPFVDKLTKFSLYTNAIALMSTEISPRMMPAIQGIRFFSICWIMLGHRYTIGLSRPMVNMMDARVWYDSWTAIYVQAAPFAVETFFVISGFLMSYLFLKARQAGKKINYLMLYIHRYLRLLIGESYPTPTPAPQRISCYLNIRLETMPFTKFLFSVVLIFCLLTPALAILILFVAVLLHRVGNGPLWEHVVIDQHVKPCQSNWWVTLLYLQNLNIPGLSGGCIPQAWYLAVDMQLFWISPFILYPLHRWPKLGLGILCSLLVASMVIPGVITAVHSYSNAQLTLTMPREQIIANGIWYAPTYNRACAYLVGILLGYDAATKKRQLSSMIVAINWTVSCILMLLCGLATKRLYNSELEYDVIYETAFSVLSRPFWSVATAWIVYACTHGYGGDVARFLSLPIFLPLSRLSYSTYLVHLTIGAVRVGVQQTPIKFSDMAFLDDYWGDLIISTAVAFFYTLFFESPFVVLEKMLTNRGSEKSPVRKPQMDEESGIDKKATKES